MGVYHLTWEKLDTSPAMSATQKPERLWQSITPHNAKRRGRLSELHRYYNGHHRKPVDANMDLLKHPPINLHDPVAHIARNVEGRLPKGVIKTPLSPGLRYGKIVHSVLSADARAEAIVETRSSCPAKIGKHGVSPRDVAETRSAKARSLGRRRATSRWSAATPTSPPGTSSRPASSLESEVTR